MFHVNKTSNSDRKIPDIIGLSKEKLLILSVELKYGSGLFINWTHFVEKTQSLSTKRRSYLQVLLYNDEEIWKSVEKPPINPQIDPQAKSMNFKGLNTFCQFSYSL